MYLSLLLGTFEKAFPKIPIIKTNSTIAETIKYVTNIFLATKVSFANEMETIANKLNIPWENIYQIVINDRRLGTSHWKVPGPDGHYGFGGTCFPKDISAMIHVANSLGINVPVIQAAWDRNIGIDRQERDWEQLKGRAIIEE
jgi:UDPglucose 6-dehydrogenase